MAESELEALRAELEKVKKERDAFQSLATDLQKRVDELSREVVCWKQHECLCSNFVGRLMQPR